MVNITEKLKTLFSDKNKTKEFLKNEEFMSKVSGGTATQQDYINAFKKFDVTLSDEGANEVMETTNKILSAPTCELGDEFMTNIVGGKNTGLAVGGSIALAGLTASVGTFIAYGVYMHKGQKATASGDEMKAYYYNTYAENLKTAASSLLLASPLAGTVGGLATNAIASGISEK